MEFSLSDLSSIVTLATTIAWLWVLKGQINANTKALEEITKALQHDRVEHVKILERLNRLSGINEED